MLLSDLPGEILSQILNGEHSWCAVELWKCGNRLLNQRLANKGVTHIDLRDTSYDSTSRWPRCLSQFRALESLFIHRSQSSLGDPTTIHNELKMLSPTLKVLSIRAKFSVQAFFSSPNRKGKKSRAKASKSTTPSSGPLHNVDKADSTNLTSTSSPQTWNWGDTWPLLETLVIFDLQRARLTPSIFSLLPRSLLRFECPSSFNSSPLQDLSGLPPGLTTISLSPGTIGPLGLASLPKSMTDIRRSLNSEALDALVTDPDANLPAIQELSCVRSDYGSDGLSPMALLEPGKSLATTLLSLQTDLDDDALFTLLPPQLTRLTIDCRLPLCDAALLPRTLTYLELGAIDWTQVKITLWPPALETLAVFQLGQFDVHCFALLPRRLKSLHIFDVMAKPARPILDAATVSKLKSVGLDCLALEQAQWLKEKTRLATLHLPIEAYIKKVEDGELFGLPLTLTKLEFVISSVFLPTHLLPPLITACRLEVAIDDSAAFDTLPPSHHFSAKVHFNKPRSNDLEALWALSPADTALYRSNISSLEISFLSAPFPGGRCRYLPRGLVSLILRVAINTSHISYLPSTLESFDAIGSQITRDCDNWVSTLPRTLKSLTLPSNFCISGDEIPHLPSNLETLSVSFTSVTLAQARTLPPRLRSLSWSTDIRESGGCLGLNSLRAMECLCRPFWRIREFSEAYLARELEMNREGTTLDLDGDLDPRTARRFGAVTH